MDITWTTFDPNGMPLDNIDAMGQVISLNYDAMGRPLPRGRTLLVRSPQRKPTYGQDVAETDGTGRRAEYVHDPTPMMRTIN